jgi:hypothetical protein
MRRSDWERWAACRTMDDLADMTVAWLHGEVQETPDNLAPPAAETIELIPALTAANRAGYLTECSQPGRPLTNGNGQRAAVSGYATDATREALAGLASDAGLMISVMRASAKRTRYTCRTLVTVSGGEERTWFGAQLSLVDLRWDYEICPEAAEAVCKAWQVTIIDPEWGRNDVLWPMLEKFAADVTA